MKWKQDKILNMIKEANINRDFELLEVKDRYIRWRMGWYWFEMYISDTTITIRSPRSHSKWRGITTYKKLAYVLKKYR